MDHSQQGSHFEFDVIVFGGGIAGLTFVLDLLDKRPQTTIALLTKKSLLESNSLYAQGGIAAAPNHKANIERHIADTLAAGDGLCNENAVRTLLADGPQRIQDLIARGIIFDHKSSGDFDLAQEGGHHERRIYRVGDHTGRSMIEILTAKVRERKRVTIFEHHIGIKLLSQMEKHTPGSQREVTAAYVLDEKTEMIHTFSARALVLATGGAGKIFRYTTNPDVATGDGIAMAYRAGARIGNLEFYQFHPTLLYHQKINNFLISEALRGEGAHLVLPDSGERFMKRYDPTNMELATRDKVARAIFSEIERGSHGYVHLDIRHRGKDFITKHFPVIYDTLLQLGIDACKDLIPVVPGAHYLCGGILTDTDGRTDLRRLFAVGECAFTGLHGANRLASNSLLEGVVMAHRCVNACSSDLDIPVKQAVAISPWDSKSVSDARRASQINAHWRGLRGEMTSYAGIVRTAEGLKDLLKILAVRRESIENYYWNHRISADLIELRNIGLLSELMARSALQRRESRGVHFREDFPEKRPTACDTNLYLDEERQ